jgi:Na+/glutamate symporter
MTRSEKIKFGLIAGVVIGVGVLVFLLIKRSRLENQDFFKQLIEEKQLRIKDNEEKIALYERLLEEKERTNEALQDQDSILNVHYNEKEIQIKQLNEVIKNIPARINRIGNNADSIARAFAEF